MVPLRGWGEGASGNRIMRSHMMLDRRVFTRRMSLLHLGLLSLGLWPSQLHAA